MDVNVSGYPASLTEGEQAANESYLAKENKNKKIHDKINKGFGYVFILFVVPPEK